jgi:hypothetical protein
MKVGSLVTVLPSRAGLYITLRDFPDQEINWTDNTAGIPMGRLWELYDCTHQEITTMHEKFIEVISESH